LDDDLKTVKSKRNSILKIAQKNLDFLDREFDQMRDLKYKEFKKELDLMLYKS